MSPFVLVHGAWSDARAWDPVIPHLTAVGRRAVAPDLPAHGADPTPLAGATLDAYAAAVEAAAEAEGAPVVLVGHSMGGTVVSIVAERRPDLVAHVVYVAAFLLPDGQSLYGFTQTSPGMADSALGPALRPGEGVLGVDDASFVDVFCADAPAALAAAARAAQRPEPLAPLGTPVAVTAARWGSVPRSYVHTAADRCVSPASQAEMVAALGVAATRTLPTSHLPMLAAPEALAAALVELTA